MTFDKDPNKVIPEVLAGINGILKSAAASPSVKRFVYTSSSTAATAPKPNKEFSITTDLWNESDIKAAWAPPPYEDARSWAVYGSSKAEAEKAVWKFVKEQKPHFVCNTVLPNCNFGQILVPEQPASSASWPKALYNGQVDDIMKALPPQWFVDVQDTGRLHVAAITNPDINNERIFAFSEPFNFNDVLRALRKIRPDHKFPEDFQDDNVRDRSKVQNQRGAELLKTFGRPGWTTLSESLANNIQDL